MRIDSKPAATESLDSEERPLSAHTVVLEAFEHNPVLDFEVFCEIIDCSTRTVERVVER